MLLRSRVAALCAFSVWSLFACTNRSWSDEASAVPTVERAVANQLVRLAFESELLGDAYDRTGLLEEALALQPEEQLTNWLIGRVQVDGKWHEVARSQELNAADPRLTEYRALRDRLDGKPFQELALARWCTEQGWHDAKRFHYARLLAYPNATKAMQTEARRILELQVVNGQLRTASEAAALEQQAKDKQQAFDLWRPRIVAWRKATDSKQVQLRQAALQELRSVEDPRAILAIEASLYDSSDAFAVELIDLLGKFRQYEATQALVRVALLTPSPTLTSAAVMQLKPRPIHDYYPQLLVLLQAPLQTEFRVLREANGTIRYEQVVAQQGSQRNHVARFDRVYSPFDRADPAFGGSGPTRTDQRGLNRMVVNSGQSTVEAQLRQYQLFLSALSFQHNIAATNTSIMLTNERVFYLLENTSPNALPRNPSQWWDWWKDYNEKQIPTPTQYVYQRQDLAYAQDSPVRRPQMSCFIAGTKVWTQTGQQAIETLQPGDRVLSRDVDSGELQFKLVINTTLQAPAPVIELTIGRDTIVASKSHPFWVNGKGWKMAKELALGDVLHTVEGPARVNGAELLPAPAPTHNLVVEDFNTYFVGDTGVLAHDVTYWKPTPVLVPGMPVAAR